MEINHSIHPSSSSRSGSPYKFSNNNNIIPDDIITEILSWLPVKCLLRFRSVCKAWLSEISNPNFTRLHLNRSPSCLLLHDYTAFMYKLPIRHLLDPFKENAVAFESRPPLPLCDIVGSANGIFCLGGDAYDGRYGQAPVPTYFWNPATKQCKELPPSRHRYVHASLGFGFDSVSSDYMVLRMGWKRTRPVVEVYSSNADSWRKITKISIKLRCEKNYHLCLATVKGVQYWDGFEEPRCLLTFDMHNEVFGQIPNFLNGATRSNIVEFRDSVAMVYYNCSIEQELDKRGFSLWTMDNDDNFGSWTKKFSFDIYPGLPLWFLKTGEILATRTGSEFLLYNPQTKESKIVYTPKWFKTEIDYTESLVSFKGSNNYFRPREERTYC